MACLLWCFLSRITRDEDGIGNILDVEKFITLREARVSVLMRRSAISMCGVRVWIRQCCRWRSL